MTLDLDSATEIFTFNHLSQAISLYFRLSKQLLKVSVNHVFNHVILNTIHLGHLKNFNKNFECALYAQPYTRHWQYNDDDQPFPANSLWGRLYH